MRPSGSAQLRPPGTDSDDVEDQPFDLAAQQLVELLELVSSFSDEASAAQGAVERAAQVLEAEVAAVVLGDRVVHAVGFPAGAVPVQALVEVAVVGRGTVEVPRLGHCSAAAAELDATGQGHLVIARLGDDGFTAAEWNLLRGMARILDLSLQMLRGMDSLRQRQRLMEHLYGIQRSISRRMPLQEVLQTVVHGLKELLGDDLVGLCLPDPQDPATLLLVAGAGLAERPDGQLWRVPVAEAGAAGRAVLADELVATDGGPALAELTGGGVRATLAAPVRENAKVVGSLFTGSRSAGRHYTDIDEEILLAFAENVTLALTDARTLSDMNEAYHDSLTGLATRPLFLERLSAGIVTPADDEPGTALLFLDLDRFKQVNDTLGHAAGDSLLMGAAKRIQAALRGGDMAARFGGDEFAVMLHSVTLAQATAVAQRIIRAVERPYQIAGRDLTIGVSIGIAMGEPDPDSLINRADAAMYHAKRAGRGCCKVYEPGMATNPGHKAADADLRRALDELMHRTAVQ
jgi:diguanylate cyclase (GGDEF)-like protein